MIERPDRELHIVPREGFEDSGHGTEEADWA